MYYLIIHQVAALLSDQYTQVKFMQLSCIATRLSYAQLVRFKINMYI